MEQKKTWERWTERTKKFPGPKYNFTKHLIHTGDYVETFPMLEADVEKVKHAAKFWAYYHKKKVKITKIPQKDGMYSIRVMLMSQHRKREYW